MSMKPGPAPYQHRGHDEVEHQVGAVTLKIRKRNKGSSGDQSSAEVAGTRSNVPVDSTSSSYSTSRERLATVPEHSFKIFHGVHDVEDTAKSQQSLQCQSLSGSTLISDDASARTSTAHPNVPVPDCITANRELELTNSQLLSNRRLLEAPMLKLVEAAVKPFVPEKDCEAVSKALTEIMVHVDPNEDCESLVEVLAMRVPVLERIAAHWQSMAKFTGHIHGMKSLNRRIKKSLEASMHHPTGFKAFASSIPMEEASYAVLDTGGNCAQVKLVAVAVSRMHATLFDSRENPALTEPCSLFPAMHLESPVRLNLIQYAVEQAIEHMQHSSEGEAYDQADILAPPTFFAVAAHAFNMLLSRVTDVSSPVKLRELVRSRILEQSSVPLRQVLSVVIRPRVRRLMENMHASNASSAPTISGSSDSSTSPASDRSGAESEHLVDEVCALLCKHAFSAGSLLALRTSCAEDMPKVTKAAMCYLAEVKELNRQQEITRNKELVRQKDQSAQPPITSASDVVSSAELAASDKVSPSGTEDSLASCSSTTSKIPEGACASASVQEERVYYVPMWAAGPGVCYPTGPPILAPPPNQSPQLPPLPTPSAHGPPMAFPSSLPGTPMGVITPSMPPFAPPSVPMPHTMPGPMHAQMMMPTQHMYTPPPPALFPTMAMQQDSSESISLSSNQPWCSQGSGVSRAPLDSTPRNDFGMSPSKSDADATPAGVIPVLPPSMHHSSPVGSQPLPYMHASSGQHVFSAPGQAPTSMYPMHMPMSQSCPPAGMYGPGPLGVGAHPHMHAMMPVPGTPVATPPPASMHMNSACMPTMHPGHMQAPSCMMPGPQDGGFGYPMAPMHAHPMPSGSTGWGDNFGGRGMHQGPGDGPFNAFRQTHSDPQQMPPMSAGPPCTPHHHNRPVPGQGHPGNKKSRRFRDTFPSQTKDRSQGWHSNKSDKHGIPAFGVPQAPQYIPVDEEQGTCQQLPVNANRSPCSHFSKHGWCPMAKICKHAHAGGRSVIANLRGYPIRPGKQVCAEYMATAACSSDMRCPFNHPNIRPRAEHAVGAAATSDGGKRVFEVPVNIKG